MNKEEMRELANVLLGKIINNFSFTIFRKSAARELMADEARFEQVWNTLLREGRVVEKGGNMAQVVR